MCVCVWWAVTTWSKRRGEREHAEVLLGATGGKERLDVRMEAEFKRRLNRGKASPSQ